MKRSLGIILLLSLVLFSCTDTTINNDNVSLCNATLMYQPSKITSAYTDSYTVSFGLDNNEDKRWTIYDQSLFTSINGEEWIESDSASFSFSKGTTTFYLKGIAYCINTKGQRCMAISVYKNKERISKASYLE